jgi:hypothetical protein
VTHGLPGGGKNSLYVTARHITKVNTYLRRDPAAALLLRLLFPGNAFLLPVPSTTSGLAEKLPISFITLRTTPSIRLSMVR